MANPEVDNHISSEDKFGKVISYEHHGTIVSVRKNLKGLHREHCLCYDCAKFKPGMPEENCPIANMIYAVCIAQDVTTPVWECSKFQLGEHYVSTNIVNKALADVLITDEGQKRVKELIENTEKHKEPGTPDLCETVEPLVEHKDGCAFVLASEARKISSEITQCDCGAITGR